MSVKLAIFVAALTLAAGASSAATLFTEGFETYALGAPASISPTWTVDEGSVDVIGPGFYPMYPGKQIDMNGSGGDSTAAQIHTAITGFTIGNTYSLSFDYGSNKNSNGNETLKYWISGLIGSVSTSGLVPDLLSSGPLYFVASSTSLNLYFADAQAGFPYNDDNDQGGPILDNINVSSVPLPAASLLLLAGLGGLGLFGRRERKIKA